MGLGQLTEFLFRALVENTGTCLAYLDLEFNFVYVNEAFARGAGHLAEDIIGRNHLTVFPDEENQAIFQRARDTGQPVAFHARPFAYPDQPQRGATYWDWTLTPVRDGAGQVQGLVWSLVDVTERELGQRGQERHLEQLNALISVSQHVLAAKTVEGLLQRIVDTAQSLTGAQIGVAGHGFEEGRFRVGVASVSNNSPASPSEDLFYVEAGGVYLELINRETSLRLTDQQLRHHPSWWGSPEGSSPIRGLLGARLAGPAGKARGMIVVSDKRQGEFTAEDEALLVQLATLASLGLQHIEARAELERRAEELGVIFAAREHLLEQLAAERAKLNAIIENAPEGIVVADAQGRVVLANPVADQLYSHPQVEAAGAPQIHYPDDTPYELDDLPLNRAALAGEVQADVEMVLHWPGGFRRHLLVNASPIHDRLGRVTGAMSVFQDITHRKRMEEALRRRNQNLDLLNAVSQTLTAILDLPQVLERLLESMSQVLTAEGSSVWLWAEGEEKELRCAALHLHGKTLPAPGLYLCPGQGVAGWVAERGESVVVADVSSDARFSRAMDAQTGYQTRSLLAVPLRIRDHVIGVLEAVNKLHEPFDDNDALVAETLAGSAAIAIENARLVDALRNRTEELRARNEELRAFAHTVAHDLKQPLTVIMGFAEILEEDYLQMTPELAQRQMTAIRRIGRKMEDIIDALLFLAEVREREVVLKPVDMTTVVAEVQQRLAPVIEEKGAEIVLAGSNSWPRALGYAPWLEEVWANYISNALKYGGRPPRVELGATPQPGGKVRYWVRDNGNGLSRDEQAALFVPFARLGRSDAQGSGLGLSIVRRIVEKLGGQVAVESEGMPGRGSVFSFILSGVNGEGKA